MEFIGNHGSSRNISSSFYLTHQQEEEEDLQLDFIYKRPLFPAPSSSSSSSSSAFRWREAVAASSENNCGGDKVPEKEHMFDKVVTPSDVGKLNRLVIPKQQAEKHFPLDTSSAAEKKGLLLCFEDRATGKPWRFRYSYWHSSQSYVMTKGWSRFVKEKGLRAGDTVSFARGVGDAARHRFFIDCKRQLEKRFPSAAAAAAARIPLPGFSSFAPPWAGGRAFFPSAVGHRLLYFKMPATRPPLPPQVELQQVGGGHRCFVNEKAATGVKRVRLFGVNLECPGSGGAANYSQLLPPPISSPPQLLPPPLSIKEQRSAMDLYL